MGRDGKKANGNDKLQPLRVRVQSVPLVVQVFLTTIVTGLLRIIKYLKLLHEKLLQFDWLRAVVFQFNLKYLHVKITNLSWVVV